MMHWNCVWWWTLPSSKFARKNISFSVVTKVSISQSSFLVVCPKLLSKFQTVNSVFLFFQQKNSFQRQHKTKIDEWNWLTCHFSLTQLPLQPQPTTLFFPFLLNNLPSFARTKKKKRSRFYAEKNLGFALLSSVFKRVVFEA